MQLNFNATEVQPASADFEPIPAGWYQCIIEKAEFLPLSNGNGSRISIMARVQGPTHQNRVLFGSINYEHRTSPQAQEIGQRQLSALCHAISVMNLQNVQQLCGVPFEGRVKITPPTYNVKGDVKSGILYEAKNEFQGFRAVGAGGAATAPATTTAPQSAPAVAKPAVTQVQAPQSAPQVAATQAPAADAVDPAVLAVAMAQIQAQQAAAARAATGGEQAKLAQPW